MRLASAGGTVTDMDTKRATQLLDGERSRIVEALDGLAPVVADEPTTARHLGDQASNTSEAELDEGLADGLRAELAAIKRAVLRIADGTYGLSIESGEAISDERLEANPTAERTIEEQTLFDGIRSV